MQKNNYRIRSLDGLRAISITIVILRHLLSQNYLNPNFKYVPVLFDGQFAVNIFFIISGFLITTLLLREEERSGSVSIKIFYLKRVLRIFPAYFFLLFIYAILQYFKIIEISRNSWLTTVTFTKFLNGGTDWYTWHTWSLSIEEWFYLIWPILFLQTKKYRQILLWLIIILVPIVKVLSNFKIIPNISDLSLFTRADAIAIGCLFAIHKAIIEVFLFKKERLFIYLLLIGILVLGILSPYGIGTTLKALSIAIAGTHGTIANLLIGLILIYSIQIQKGWWYKVLNHKTAVYIGTLSYSLYLWQQFFIHDTIKWYNKFPVNLLFIIICAMGSYYLIEKPFLKLKSLIYSRYNKVQTDHYKKNDHPF